MGGVPPGARRKDWIGLGVLALPCMLYSMDLTVLNLAAPHLSADLKPSSTELLWIVDIYGFLIAGSLLTMGTLGDRIGRRRLLLIGAVAFSCASVLAAFSANAKMLIAARALLGVAAATLAPSTLSLLRNMFADPRQRTFAIAVWSASFAVGAAIGPIVGGVLLTYFWWGSVFLINVPILLLLLVLGPIFLPEYRAPEAGRVDMLSAALSVIAVLAVIFGLKSIAEHGAMALPIAAISGGAAVGWAFLRRQRRLREPVIDLSLFRSAAFSGALAASVLAFFVNFATFFFIAQYLQLVLGLSSIQAGLWTLPSAGAFIIGSIFAPRLVGWTRAGNIMVGGFLLAAAGLAVLSQMDGRDALAVLVAGTVMLAMGLAPIIILSADLIVSAAPAERAGLASGLSEASTELGGALGIALLGSVMSASYHGAMSNFTLSDVPADAMAAAQHTLGCAMEIAAQLPAGASAALLDAAQGAFIDGVRLAMKIGVGVAVAAAILAAVLLRTSKQQSSKTGGSRNASSLMNPLDATRT
jgi:MFS transporter, DHA2 family, multidrug resistance protein